MASDRLFFREGSVYSFEVVAPVAMRLAAASAFSRSPLNLLRNRFRKNRLILIVSIIVPGFMNEGRL